MTDVGGGCVPNGTPKSLARLPLRWMIRECFRAGTGIQFKADYLEALGLNPESLWPEVIKPGAHDVPNHVGNSMSRKDKNMPDAEISIPTTVMQRALMRLETDADKADAGAELFDQLKRSRWWWFLELLPIRELEQEADDGRWKKKWTFNRGRPRKLPARYYEESKEKPKEKLLVHKSVRARMNDKNLQPAYKPMISFQDVEVDWVD